MRLPSPISWHVLSFSRQAGSRLLVSSNRPPSPLLPHPTSERTTGVHTHSLTERSRIVFC